MSELKEILAHLIQYESISPNDAGCQTFMMSYLTELGFECNVINQRPVTNFFAQIGHDRPLLIFAGHTDVVPEGDRSKWLTNPFELHELNGLLYGRGTADMKGSLACMMVAAKQFLATNPSLKGSLGFLITSGEEGDDFEKGTPYVMQKLNEQGIIPDYCVVGEPSSSERVGDVIKIGRRGSLTGRLTLHGKQGHVAYPHLAENPIHRLSPVLAELTAIEWDKGNDYFPPTSMQITQIHSGGHAGNIIPGDLSMQFNFRYSTEQTAEALKETVNNCFARYELTPEIQWQHNGKPFLMKNGRLLDVTLESIDSLVGQKPLLSTSGGTSDGRFIAPYGVEVIELGPVNATIHQVNECVSLSELESLSKMYYLICQKLLK